MSIGPRRLIKLGILLMVLSVGALGAGACASRAAPPSVTLRVSGSGEALPLVQRLASEYSKRHPEVRWQFEAGVNTGGAIRGVGEGTLDLAVAARPLSDEEAREPLDYHVFARDAVAFAVRDPNPLQELTTDQLRAIYGRQGQSWQAFGGDDTPVLVLDRDADDSTRKLALMLVLGDRPVRANTIVLTKAREMVQALEGTPSSIGYASLSLIRLLSPRDVRVLALDGVMPGRASIAAGSYPYTIAFGLIHRRDASAGIRDFVEFARGPRGAEIAERYDAASSPF